MHKNERSAHAPNIISWQRRASYEVKNPCFLIDWSRCLPFKEDSLREGLVNYELCGSLVQVWNGGWGEVCSRSFAHFVLSEHTLVIYIASIVHDTSLTLSAAQYSQIWFHLAKFYPQFSQSFWYTVQYLVVCFSTDGSVWTSPQYCLSHN